MSRLNNRAPLRPIVPTSYLFLPKFDDYSSNIHAMASMAAKPQFPYQIAKFVPPPQPYSRSGVKNQARPIASGVANFDRSSIRQFDCPVGCSCPSCSYNC